MRRQTQRERAHVVLRVGRLSTVRSTLIEMTQMQFSLVSEYKHEDAAENTWARPSAAQIWWHPECCTFRVLSDILWILKKKIHLHNSRSGRTASLSLMDISVLLNDTSAEQLVAFTGDSLSTDPLMVFMSFTTEASLDRLDTRFK